MEFFDFTGTNEEEKAQALDIITHESSGVEFVFNYRNNIENTNRKCDYMHVNGDIVSSNNDSHDDGNNNNTNSYSTNNPLNETWDNTTNQQPQLNDQSATNVCVVTTATAPLPPHQYLYPHPGAYFQAAHHGHPPPPPPPNHYSLHALHHSALGPPHPVNQHPKQLMNIPPVAIQNIGVSSSNQTNPSHKNATNVNAPSNCDIHNSIYMSSSQYSDAPVIENGRLKNPQVTADGGNMMNDASLVVSNGTAAGPPPPHHLGPAYPSYAFPHQTPPHALTTFSQFTSPIIYVSTDNTSFIQYTAFSPTPTHLPTIPAAAAAAHHATVMTNTATNDNILPPTTTNTMTSAPPKSALSSTATVSNLSSMSVSSSSIHTAAYQQHSSTTTDSAIFETNTNSNDSYLESEESSSSNNNNNTKNSPNSTSKKSDVNNDTVSQQVPSQSTTFQQDDNPESSNDQVDNESSSTKQVQEYLRQCLNINDNKQNDDNQNNNDKNDNNNQVTTTAQDNSESIYNSDQQQPQPNTSSIENSSSVKSNLTWASKLFPTSMLPSSPIITNNDNQQTNKISSTSSSSNLNSRNNEANNTNENKISSSSTFAPNTECQDVTFVFKSSNNSINHNNHINHNNNKRLNKFNEDDFKKLTIIPMKNDPIAFKLAKRLRDSIHLKHSLPTIMPCGLINRGNWCYINATLQALLACPPFYNLMREISETPGLFRQSTSTPIIDNFARYFSKFLPSDYKRQMKTNLYPFLEELLNNDPFEPKFIYDTLKHIGMIKNDAQRGHQEDAEEFLSSVLNGLNEEMIQLSKLLNESNNSNDKRNSAKTNGFSSDDLDIDGDNYNDSDALIDSSNDIWHEVGTSKHKALPTRSARVISTLITEIFGGSTLDIRTVNKDKDSCGNRQPFFTLQLDIKPPSIKSLVDAIRWQTKSETIHGYQCSKTKQFVDASSQMFLENLPPILIFHLKLFDYEIETGASKKLLKTIDFLENFEIPRECCTAGKMEPRFRKYKLLAVVYHSGSEAINGHYITDVYHLGLNQWLRCDDASIKVISLSKVLNGNEREGQHNMVPYLLFYRRFDTLHNKDNNNNSSSSSSSSNNQANNNNNNNGTKSRNNIDLIGFHMSGNGHHANNNHDHNNDIMIHNKFSTISRH